MTLCPGCVMVHSASTACRYALLSLAACEAALQLELPQYASVHEHWITLQERSKQVVPPGPYGEVLGEGKASTYGEDVVFVANDWHAGVPRTTLLARPHTAPTAHAQQPSA